VVTLLCDSGERYRHTYHHAAWRESHGLCCDPEVTAMSALLQKGQWPAALLGGWALAGALRTA